MRVHVRECAVRVKEKMTECLEHSGAATATAHGAENFPGGFSFYMCMFVRKYFFFFNF